jgi:hypothetical protein
MVEHLSSPPVFSGVRVTRSLVLCVCLVDRCLPFCPFSFGHCVVCPSLIYGFLLPFWYLQTIRFTPKNLRNNILCICWEFAWRCRLLTHQQIDNNSKLSKYFNHLYFLFTFCKFTAHVVDSFLLMSIIYLNSALWFYKYKLLLGAWINWSPV